MHDFIVVAVLYADLTKAGARDNLQIALDRDTERVNPKLVQHLDDAHSARHPAMLAVDADSEASIETHRART